MPTADEPPRRSLFAERKIDGQFRKWNTNDGKTVETKLPPAADGAAGGADADALSPAAAAAAAAVPGQLRLSSDLVPQAFSHFTIDFSMRPTSSFRGLDGKPGRCLVCDLQGCFDIAENTFLFSDPVIHSELGQRHLFGATDNGAAGIAAFLRSHKCNDVCRLLHLPENRAFVEEYVGQLENSSVNTTFVSLVPTHHFTQRAAERKMERRECQAAKKRGEKYRGLNGNIKHELGDVKVVTTPDFKTAVTTMRSEAATHTELQERPPLESDDDTRRRPHDAHTPPSSLQPALLGTSPATTLPPPTPAAPVVTLRPLPPPEQPPDVRDALAALDGARSADALRSATIEAFAFQEMPADAPSVCGGASVAGIAGGAVPPQPSMPAATGRGGRGRRGGCGRGCGREGASSAPLGLAHAPAPALASTKPPSEDAQPPVQRPAEAEWARATLAATHSASGGVAPVQTAALATDESWQVIRRPARTPNLARATAAGETAPALDGGASASTSAPAAPAPAAPAPAAPAPASAPKPPTAEEEARRAGEAARTAEERAERERAAQIREDWIFKRDQGERGNLCRITFATWYRSLPIIDQRVVEKTLSRAEYDEIAAGSGAFLSVVSATAGGGATTATAASPASADLRSGAPNADSSSAAGAGSSGNTSTAALSGSRFGMLMLLDAEEPSREFRKSEKKARRLEEKAAAAAAAAAAELQAARARKENASARAGSASADADERDQKNVSRLAKAHSTASAAAPTSARPRAAPLKRLTAAEIEATKTVKALRRLLTDRGVADANQFDGQPDEIKQLRRYARSLPSVCSEASSTPSGRFHSDQKKADPEIEHIMAQLNDYGEQQRLAAADGRGTVSDLVGAIAGEARELLGSAASAAADAAASAVSSALGTAAAAPVVSKEVLQQRLRSMIDGKRSER